MTRRRFAPWLLTGALLLPSAAAAQQPQATPLLPESRVWVEGTSNREDWSVHATELHGSVSLRATTDALAIEGGSFTVPARRMASEQGVIMDRLMHGALKAAAHPEIVYHFLSASVTPRTDGSFSVATRGRLTLAGVTRDIEQTVEARRLPNGTVRFTGSQPILLSDYGMTPPTAMYGALRTGNRVVVHLDLVVKP
jgi:polyisoprenoid-binding protein YceI